MIDPLRFADAAVELTPHVAPAADRGPALVRRRFEMETIGGLAAAIARNLRLSISSPPLLLYGNEKDELPPN
jgi:hypothetical protein